MTTTLPATPGRIPTARRAPRALVVIRGDDVYEDLFTASVELQAILTEAGFAAQVRMGTVLLRDALPELVVVFTAGGRDARAEHDALRDAVRAGTGLISIHSSNLGAPSGLVGTRFLDHGPRPHASRFAVELDPAHPLAAGVGSVVVDHEHYRVAVDPGATVVGWRTTADGGREAIVTAMRPGRGGSVWIQLGHDMRVWDEPGVRRLIRNAAHWTTTTDHPRPTTDGRS